MQNININPLVSKVHHYYLILCAKPLRYGLVLLHNQYDDYCLTQKGSFVQVDTGINFVSNLED